MYIYDKTQNNFNEYKLITNYKIKNKRLQNYRCNIKAMYNITPLQGMRYHCMKWAPDVLNSIFMQFHIHQISLRMTYNSRNLLLN